MDTIIKIGEQGPLFHLPDLEGDLHSLEEYLGRIVVLNFWSAECDWCKRVDEEIIHYLDVWKDRVKVLWIASNANESLDLVEKTALERKLPTVMIDAELKVADIYGAQTTPNFFILDRVGNLRYQGAWDDITFRQRKATRVYVPMVIEALIHNQVVEVTSTPAYGCTLVRHPE
jgi:thiol-disulfide isomerase/thioredoxin